MIELIAVAVAFVDDMRLCRLLSLVLLFTEVNLRHLRPFFDTAGIGSQAHRASFVHQCLLRLHHVYHVVRGAGIKLRGVGIRIAQHVAGKLDSHTLHTHTDTEARYLMFARITQGGKLPFHAAGAEARCNHNTLITCKFCRYVLLRQVVRQYGFQHQLAVVVGSSVSQRFTD